MEEKSGKKEKMLSAIIENAREAVVSVDADGRIIYANKATEDLFGWKIEELLGKPMSILAVDAEEQKKQFMEALRKGGARFETVRKARDGSIIPVLMTVVPFKDENGNLIFSSGIMVDIREQKKYESKIEHLNEVLHAIRNVNQLIAKEKNEEKLLQKACDILVEVKGYTSVYISYNGKNYMAGEKKEYKKALEFIKKRGTEKKEIASYEFNGRYLTVSPIVKNSTRAFLYIIQSKKINKEETGLLKEISGDIAFALDSIYKERKLKEKEILLSNVFESVQDGISILDTDLTIRHVNSAMEKWYEKSMPLVGKKCYEAYHNRKKPCDPCPSLRCMKSGKMEREIVSDPFKQYIELFSYPIKDESGNVTGVAEFVRDITERKKAEEKMKESEERFRQFFENAPDYCYMISPDGKILNINKSALRALGYRKKEVVGKPLIETIYSPSSQEKAKKIFEKWKETGKIRNEELTIVTKKGEERAVLLSVDAVKDAEGNIIHSISIQRDITNIKKMEEALKESEEKYRTLIENANDGICIIKDGLMVFANPRLLEMGGYSEQDVINQPFSKFISEESLKEVVDKYKKRMTGEKVESFYEAVIKRKDGGKIFAEFNVSLIDYEGGTAELVIVRDITEREKLMNALKESEERYRAIVENSHAGILVVGEDYKFSYVNDTLCNMLGYTRKELIGHDFREFLDEESRGLVADRYVRRQRGEDVPPRYECNVVRKDGEKRCVEISSAVMKDSKGNMMTISQLLDITERKKAEEERLRLATGVYQAAEEIIITDTDGNIQYVNPAFEKITGYSRDEVIGKNPRILKSGKHDKKFYENLWNTILSGKTWNGEFVNKRKDGTLYIERASISPVKDDSGRIINFIAVKSDITEQKKTEEALKESEERFRSLVENAQDAIYIITPEGFEYVNPAFEELTGYSSEEIYSKDFDFRNLIHPDDVKKIEEREKAREKGKELPSRYEFRIVTKDGKERIVEARTVGIGKGKGARIIGILRDMTERIKAEEKMKRILEQEKEFKLATAHYFFNPIAIAKGYLSLAMEKAYDEDQVEKLKAAEHAIERVEKVVKNVTQKGEIYE